MRVSTWGLPYLPDTSYSKWGERERARERALLVHAHGTSRVKERNHFIGLKNQKEKGGEKIK